MRAQNSGHSRSRLVYILAASHSGSTLLSMLLGSHPRICSVGELKLTSLGDLERYRCSCGELIRKCGFWSRVRAGMRKRGFDFEIGCAGTDYRSGVGPLGLRLLKPLYRGGLWEIVRDGALLLMPSWRHAVIAIQARNAALIATILDVTGKKVVVDSSKVGLQLKHLLRNSALDVRVIRLVRDGRAVSLTYVDTAQFAEASRPELRGGGGGGYANERLSMSAAARRWRRSNEEAEAILRLVDPSRWIEIRYESLCRDPRAELARVTSFLEEDSDLLPVDFRAVEHHVVGNGMRLDNSSEVRLDERWRTALRPEDLAEFDAVAGDMNRRMGYR